MEYVTDVCASVRVCLFYICSCMAVAKLIGSQAQSCVLLCPVSKSSTLQIGSSDFIEANQFCCRTHKKFFSFISVVPKNLFKGGMIITSLCLPDG